MVYVEAGGLVGRYNEWIMYIVVFIFALLDALRCYELSDVAILKIPVHFEKNNCFISYKS